MTAQPFSRFCALVALGALLSAGCVQRDATTTRQAEASVAAIRGADGQLVRATAATRDARTLSQRIEDNAHALLSDK